MTLLERFDQMTSEAWVIGNRDEIALIRRAIAIAQAVDELHIDRAPSDDVAAVLWQIMDRADELLKATSAPAR